MRIITAIGDSIVDTVGRGSTTETTQWMYLLMKSLGETNIKFEPLPEYSRTPNILVNKWAAFPNLCNGVADTNYEILSNSTHTINLSSSFLSSTPYIWGVRVFTEGPAFTLRVSLSKDNVTWKYPPATSLVSGSTITKAEGHSPGWSFCSWYFSETTAYKYIRFEITGDMKVSEVQVLNNLNGEDRGSCLNKMVGENYVFNNVGLGSNKAEACLQRFVHDVIDLGSETVIILAGINDIAQGISVSAIQNSLMSMYDLADEAGMRVIPCTLLPYTGSAAGGSTGDLFRAVNSKILTVNAWIRSTAAVRRYGLCDWYSAMEDPNYPGRIIPAYTGDGIHLSVLGNAKIIEAFDLSQLSIVTHDFYGMPVYNIPFSADRDGDLVNLDFGNTFEKNYQIYLSSTAGVSLSSTLVGTINEGLGTFAHTYQPDGYYRIYGADTNVWSEEIFIVGVPIPPPPPTKTPTKVKRNIGISTTNISNKAIGIRSRY